MSIFNKLISSIRDNSATKDEEVVIDTQVLHKLNLELNDAREEINRSKIKLIDGLNKEKIAIDKYNKLKSQINTYIQYATDALEKGNEALAIKTSKVIAGCESQLALEDKAKIDSSQSVKELRRTTICANINVKRLQQQISMYKTTGIIQEP